MKVTFRISRYDPETNEGSYVEDFLLEVEEYELTEVTVLDALVEIKEDQDGSLTFRHGCGHGSCGSCAVLINEKNRLACETHLDDLELDEKTVVEVSSLPGFPTIKDLVVDMDNFFRNDRLARPFISGEDERSGPTETEQTPGELRRILEATECINCGACTASCPTYWENEGYLGPAALVRAYRWMEDSRNSEIEERLAALDDEKDGVWGCNKFFNCLEACPKEIDTVGIIEALKRSVITS